MQRKVDARAAASSLPALAQTSKLNADHVPVQPKKSEQSDDMQTPPLPLSKPLSISILPNSLFGSIITAEPKSSSKLLLEPYYLTLLLIKAGFLSKDSHKTEPRFVHLFVRSIGNSALLPLDSRSCTLKTRIIHSWTFHKPLLHVTLYLRPAPCFLYRKTGLGDFEFQTYHFLLRIYHLSKPRT